MRRSGRLLIVLGVVLALAALLLAIFALAGGDDDGSSGNGETKPQDVTIVQAKRDIAAHTKLKADDLEEVVVKDDTVTEDNARDINEVVGFAYSEDLIDGQRILRSRLEISGIAEELEPGTRAMALEVSKSNLVAGLIRQDDRVDIIYEVNLELMRINPTTPVEVPDRMELLLELTLPPLGEDPDPAPYPYPGEPGSRFTVTEADGGNPVTKVVLQSVRVLRVIQPATSDTADSTNEASFIVLEVDPAQAELVTLMSNVGVFHVMLRGPEDDEIVNTDGLNMELLVTEFGLPVPKSVRLPGPGAQ